MLHQKIDGADFPPVDRLDPGPQQGLHFAQHQERRQVASERLVVGKRIFLRFGLEKEIERIDDRHFDDQIDHHAEVLHQLGKRDTGQKIGLRILLPIEKVLLRLDAK